KYHNGYTLATEAPLPLQGLHNNTAPPPHPQPKRPHHLASGVAATMAETVVPQHRIVITNKYGEKLDGTLHETGSKGLVILCHGFRSTKDEKIFLNLAATITREGISTFCFDFSGNGLIISSMNCFATYIDILVFVLLRESEGSFQYGNYWKEADDLHYVIQHFLKEQRDIIAIAGHSKGYFFNPRHQYSDSPHNDGEVLQGTINVIGRLSRSMDERIDAMIEMNRFKLKLDIYRDYDVKEAVTRMGPGGNVVLLYASSYHDVNVVVNISGRFALDQGIEERLGKDFAQRVEEAGYIDVKSKT
ncbi:hypothetical protein Taro_001597, partial [Colocasia esculenta]|nr:hypothetical protein [Colocasia esculenta]